MTHPPESLAGVDGVVPSSSELRHCADRPARLMTRLSPVRFCSNRSLDWRRPRSGAALSFPTTNVRFRTFFHLNINSTLSSQVSCGGGNTDMRELAEGLTRW